MTDFRIVEARPYHCGQMARLLRSEQKAAVAKLGIDSHREMRDRFDASCFRRAWLINGSLAALGGVTGSHLADDGYVWLAIAKAATQHPKQMIIEGRRQIAEIMSIKRTLHTVLLDGDEASRRFAIFMGFVPTGSGEMAATSRFGRRNIEARVGEIETVPVGHGFAVPMIYHRESNSWPS